jgi:hypothetical protein
MDHEHRVDRQKEAEQESVEKGLVVGDDEQARRREGGGVARGPDSEQGLEGEAEQGFDEGSEHGVMLRDGRVAG